MIKKEKNYLDNISHRVWLVISFATAILIWVLIANSEGGKLIFAGPIEVINAFIRKVSNGSLWPHVYYSLTRVLLGFGFAFVASIPAAFLMAWYEPIRNLIEPWIQFIRNIPPLAYIPLVVLGAGVGESSKVIVIFIAAFLTLVVTIYQGVRSVDKTLINAAKVLGASEFEIFYKVIIPASTPFILVGSRLGLSASLTTLIAAELTCASKGLGMLTRQASSLFILPEMLLGIILIGIIGMTFEK